MIAIIHGDGSTEYRQDHKARLSYQIEGTKQMADASPSTDTPNVDTMRKSRGPRSLTGKSFSLVYNRETELYEMSFEGRNRNIRFESPVNASGLINPLAGGMIHKSGRHNFKLSFGGDHLIRIVNVDSSLADGEEPKLVESVNVPFDSELAKWIRVIVETDVATAARQK